MSFQYDAYLDQHMQNIRAAMRWCRNHEKIADKLPRMYMAFEDSHDASKRSAEEYDAYDRYLFADRSDMSEDELDKIENEYQKAWIKHIRFNSHHWQYWCVGGFDPLDMDDDSVIEMVMNWWSYNWDPNDGDLRALFDWYDMEKDSMILSDKTREKVEEILDIIKECLDDDDAEKETEVTED